MKKTNKDKINLLNRSNIIKQTLANFDNGLTARELANKLHFVERNSTAPRLTNLVKKGEVIQVGKRYDKITKRLVTVYKIKNEVTSNG